VSRQNADPIKVLTDAIELSIAKDTRVSCLLFTSGHWMVVTIQRNGSGAHTWSPFEGGTGFEEPLNYIATALKITSNLWCVQLFSPLWDIATVSDTLSEGLHRCLYMQATVYAPMEHMQRKYTHTILLAACGIVPFGTITEAPSKTTI
jgi:hypothetical protein